MAAYGYFGKIPSARDFVFQGLPMRTTDAWANHMIEWLTAGRMAARTDWVSRFLMAPVWRFTLPAGVLGAEGWVGLLAASIDSIGREFPVTVMIEADIATDRCQPIGALDPWLDLVEERLIAFVEGQIGTPALMAALGDVAGDIGRTAEIAAGTAATGTLILPRADDDGLCLDLAAGAAPWSTRAEAAYAWPTVSPAAPDAPLCLWWHEGGDGQAANICVSRGIPGRSAAAPFLVGGWPTLGWHAHDPASYLAAARAEGERGAP